MDKSSNVFDTAFYNNIPPEHPRASTTEDVECFFSVLRDTERGTHSFGLNVHDPFYITGVLWLEEGSARVFKTARP